MKQNADCYAVYSRKSKFTGKGESIENQIELCREYISRVFGEDDEKKIAVYEDEGYSGKNTARPAFKKMMKDAQQRKFKSVVVYRLDRISRNISDFSSLIEELSKLDIDFVSIREQFDTSSPMGRAMMYISSVFSQLERETIAERIRDNMHELAKTGRWLGGTTPTGYASEAVQSVTVDGKLKKACKLTPIEKEKQLIREIFDLFLKKESLTYTEAELLRNRAKTKTGKNFTRFALKAILQNPVYVIADKDVFNYFKDKGSEIYSPLESFDGVHGILAYNRTDQEKGRATIYLPENEWMISVGAHEGFITGKDWIKAQECLNRNKNKAYRRPRTNEALLTGLVFCSCGNRMYAKLSNRRNTEGETIYSYMCSMKLRSKRRICKVRNAGGNELDAAVTEEIKKLGETENLFSELLEKSKKHYAGERVPYEERIAERNKELAANQTKITTLVDSLAETSEKTVRKEITRRIEELARNREMMEAKIREYRDQEEASRLYISQFNLLSDLLRRCSSSVDEMDIDQKRAAIRMLVRKVVWDGENAHIFLFGTDGDADIPHMAALPAEETENQNTKEEEQYVGLKMLGERISNEILMYFRSRKKTAGDVSLSEALDADGDGNGLLLMDVVASEDDLADQISSRELCRTLRTVVETSLDEREARIIRLRYGLEGGKPLTQLETAGKCRISRSYVSRIEKRALEKLRAALEGKEAAQSV